MMVARAKAERRWPDSDLTGADFVTLLNAGYRPDHRRDGQLRLRPRPARAAQASRQRRRDHHLHPGLLRRARDRDGAAAGRPLPRVATGSPDAPAGIVGMTVSEVHLRRLRCLGPADRRVHRARHRDRATSPPTIRAAPRAAASRAGRRRSIAERARAPSLAGSSRARRRPRRGARPSSPGPR